MRIGLDGRELVGNPTGVGRYLASLCQEWARLGEHRFIIYLPAPLEAVPDQVARIFRGAPEQFEIRVVPGRATTVWEQVRLPPVANRDGLDVFFAPGYSAPLALRCPLVVAMHDVSFAAHPEWFAWREGLRRRWLARRAARRARAVVTLSEFSRGEIVRHLGIAAARVRVIPPGVTRLGRPRHPREPLVLFVGSIFNRRRVPDLIEAFARLAASRSDVRLLIVGENRTYPPQDLARLISVLNLRDRVTLASYVPDGDLAALYGRARVFAFPSEYEGFGLTVLEAIAAGVPPVVLDTPVAREAYRDAAWYVPRGDVDALAAALATLLVDETVRAVLCARGAALVERYTWASAAQATLGVLDQAARGSP